MVKFCFFSGLHSLQYKAELYTICYISITELVFCGHKVAFGVHIMAIFWPQFNSFFYQVMSEVKGKCQIYDHI